MTTIKLVSSTKKWGVEQVNPSYLSYRKETTSSVRTSCESRPITRPMHSRILRAAINRPPADWRRRAGRPRRTWLRTIELDFQPYNLGLNTAWMRAQDRSKWRQLVETAMLNDGRATRWWRWNWTVHVMDWLLSSIINNERLVDWSLIHMHCSVSSVHCPDTRTYRLYIDVLHTARCNGRRLLEMGKKPNPARTIYKHRTAPESKKKCARTRTKSNHTPQRTEQNPNPNVTVLLRSFHWIKL